MRLLHRRRPGPRAKTARPAAEPYLAVGAEEARRLGHNYVGTEHLLLVFVRDPDGGATRVLQQLDVPPRRVEEALASWLGASGPPDTTRPMIDPDAVGFVNSVVVDLQGNLAEFGRHHERSEMAEPMALWSRNERLRDAGGRLLAAAWPTGWCQSGGSL